MRVSRVFVLRVLLLWISAVSLYMAAFSFMGDPDAHLLGPPAVVENGGGHWRSVLGLDSLLSEVDQELHHSAKELKNIQHRIDHIAANYTLPGAWAPLSPAEYVLPLHSAALLLYILPSPGLLACSEVEQLSDGGPASVPHPLAETRKLSSLTKDYLSQSIPSRHPFAVLCQSQNSYVDGGSEECYRSLNQRLMVEGIFRQELDHYIMIAKLTGYCIKGPSSAPFDSPNAVTLLTEYGTPLYINKIIQAPFKRRLSLAVDLAHVLTYLNTSKYGSLQLHNLSYDSFIVVDQRVKLFDLSGLDNLQPLCTKHDDCAYSDTLLGHCDESSGTCVDGNAKANMFNFNQLFFQKLLQDTDDVPMDLKYRVVQIRERTSQLKFSVLELFNQLKEVLNILDPTPQPPVTRTSDQSNSASHCYYKMIQNADLKGRHDYLCPHTRAPWGCVLPVYTLDNAKILCNADSSCKAMVVIPHTRQRGWYTVFYKNGTGPPDTHVGASLYIKLDRSRDEEEINTLVAEESWEGSP